jgi:hypothetical protein
MVIENVAAVPLTLSEAEKLADPPKVKLSTRRYVPSSGGGFKCPHIVCVLLLPILVYKALVPDKNTEVTVEEGGVRTLELHYDDDERLLHATRWRAGHALHIEPLSLDHLGRRLLVERWRTPVDGAQRPTGPRERAPLGPQLDLVTPYREALAARPTDLDRGELLIEAVTVLQEEARPLLELYLRAPTSDTLRAQGLGAACGEAGSRACELALSLVVAEGPVTLGALSSALSRRGDRAGAERASAEVVARYCAADEKARPGAFSLASQHAGFSRSPRDATDDPYAAEPSVGPDAGAEAPAMGDAGAAARGPVDEVLSTCPEPRRVALLLASRRVVGRAELDRALSASPEDAVEVAEGLRCAVAPHREAARAMVARGASHDAAAQTFFARWCDAFDELDHEAAAIVYARATRPEPRERLLSTFFEAAHALRAERAVAALSRALEGAPEGERAALSAGLVALARLEHERPASRGLDPQATSHWDTRTQHGLIASALRLRGCSDARIRELAREASSVRPSERGRVCDVPAKPRGSSSAHP